MKKILSILLAIAVTISFMPAASFAATDGNVKHQDDELIYMKQQVIEVLDDFYEESVMDDSYYVEDVYQEINNLYDTACQKVRDAKKLEDFLQDGLFGYVLSDELMAMCEMIEYLGTLTKQQGIYGDDALSKCIADLEKYKAEVFKTYNLSKYNNWYQDIIEEYRFDIEDAIAELKENPSFAGCAKVESMIEKIDAEEDDDDFDWSTMFEDDEYEEDYIYYLDEEKFVYTKAELAEEIGEMTMCLELYKDEALKEYAAKNSLKKTSKKYKNMSAALDKIIDGFAAAAKKLPDIESIYNKYVYAMIDLEEKAGLAGEDDPNVVYPSSSDYERLYKAIEELYMSYDMTLYSETQQENMEDLFDHYAEEYEFTYTKEEAETMESRAAAREAFVKKVKAEFDKIPVKTVELKNTRTKYYNKLVKKYKTKGKKKYNQKKVKKLLAAAKKKMNACKEPEDIEDIYEDYIYKLNGTIHKYRIKTSKKGKGTISKTKKVKYGKSCRVKFTPKAGYKIKKIYVDGKKLKKLRNSYTFKKVKKAHKIKVVFSK